MMSSKQKNALDKFWRIYFWIIMIIWVIIIEAVITDKKLFPETCTTYSKLITAGLYIIATTGLFGYTYKKNIFSPVFWKIFFCVLLFWEIYTSVVLSPPAPDTTTLGCCIGLILFIPLYLAVFLYAFKYKK